jgi:hypothetical protein
VDRRAKVELFEQIRREYEHGGGTIRGIAKKLGIHRRMVREAVFSAVPMERKTPVRERPKLEQLATALGQLWLFWVAPSVGGALRGALCARVFESEARTT